MPIFPPGLAALNPEYSSGTSFKIGEDTYDIIIRNDIPGDEENEEEEAETEKKDKTVDDLRRVQIQNANGGLHDLQDLASVNYGRGRTRIMRVNQDKQIEVFYNFSKDVQSSKTCSRDIARISTSWLPIIICRRGLLWRCSMKKMSLQTLSS